MKRRSIVLAWTGKTKGFQKCEYMTLKEQELICFRGGIQGSIHSTRRTIRFMSLKFSTNKVQWFFFASLKGKFEWQPGLFPFNKNSGLKFRKFHAPNGTVYSGCTDPTQATAGLVIILVSRMQKSGAGQNNFVKWKGTFRSDRPKWEDLYSLSRRKNKQTLTNILINANTKESE